MSNAVLTYAIAAVPNAPQAQVSLDTLRSDVEAIITSVMATSQQSDIPARVLLPAMLLRIQEVFLEEMRRTQAVASFRKNKLQSALLEARPDPTRVLTKEYQESLNKALQDLTKKLLETRSATMGAEQVLKALANNTK